jgi:hypothetical protein
MTYGFRKTVLTKRKPVSYNRTNTATTAGLHPGSTERTTAMTALNSEITYHVQGLERVATDLRNERLLATSPDGAVRRIRVAVGSALVQIGTALTASQRQVGAEAR